VMAVVSFAASALAIPTRDAPVLTPHDERCTRYGSQKLWGPELEPLLHQCIRTLASSPLMARRGTIMDAGANSGEGSVQLACDFPNHIVVAVEPTKVNYERLNTLTAGMPNVRTVWGGLSSTRQADMAYAAKIDTKGPGIQSQTGKWEESQAAYYHNTKNISLVHFPAYTVDELIPSSAPLAFAHWDVEGFEHELLLGARVTLLRDAPLFTVESFPASKPRHTKSSWPSYARSGIRHTRCPSRAASQATAATSSPSRRTRATRARRSSWRRRRQRNCWSKSDVPLAARVRSERRGT